MSRMILPAYVASLQLGARLALQNRSEIISKLIIYAVLLAIFYTIYHMMPLEQFGVPGLTAEALLWYFAITEIVQVACQGPRREFGRQIATGELSILMQRPGNMMGLILTRVLGNFMSQAMILFLFALIVLPLLAHAPMTMSAERLPLLFISLALSAFLYLLMGYMVSMLEIFGPYSQPVDWMVSKFNMVLGGLFLPVSLFPPLAQKIAMMTPFPSVMFAPASLMLSPDLTTAVDRIALQIFWALTLLTVVVAIEGRLLRRVLMKGD